MKKLLQFQQKVGAIGKDSINPFFKSKYFDINKLIEVLKPVLNELELVLAQPLTTIDGKPAIKTILIDTETGEKVEDSIVMPENTDPQKMGSTITYFRRYSIQSLLLLQAEDDDGNVGAGNNAGLDEDTKRQIASIQTIDELRDYYQKNKGKGKEFDRLVTERKAELSV